MQLELTLQITYTLMTKMFHKYVLPRCKIDVQFSVLISFTPPAACISGSSHCSAHLFLSIFLSRRGAVKRNQATESARTELNLGHLLTFSFITLGKLIHPSAPQFPHL